jgi:hypothetical protein
VEEQWGGDVIRNVSDDDVIDILEAVVGRALGVGSRSRVGVLLGRDQPTRRVGEMNGERIPLDDRHPQVVRVFLPQHRRERPIELDRDDPPSPGNETVRQSAPSGADLDYGFAAVERKRIDDPVEDPWVGEEMLPEPLERRREPGRGGAIARRRHDRLALSRGE